MYRALSNLKFILLLIAMMVGFWPLYGQILKKPIPDKTVVLTFDDAPASHYSHVAPLFLKRSGSIHRF
ncbi:MAG: hypothetical protein WD431_08075 [Cyclobacteriaceae bacterium]